MKRFQLKHEMRKQMTIDIMRSIRRRIFTKKMQNLPSNGYLSCVVFGSYKLV